MKDHDERERDRLACRQGPDIATEAGALTSRCRKGDQIDREGSAFGGDDEERSYIVRLVRTMVRDLHLEGRGLLGAHVGRDVGHESEIGGFEWRANGGGEAPGVVARESVLRRRAHAHGEACVPEPQIALEGDAGGSVSGDERNRTDDQLLPLVRWSAVVERRLEDEVRPDEPSFRLQLDYEQDLLGRTRPHVPDVEEERRRDSCLRRSRRLRGDAEIGPRGRPSHEHVNRSPVVGGMRVVLMSRDRKPEGPGAGFDRARIHLHLNRRLVRRQAAQLAFPVVTARGAPSEGPVHVGRADRERVGDADPEHHLVGGGCPEVFEQNGRVHAALHRERGRACPDDTDVEVGPPGGRRSGRDPEHDARSGDQHSHPDQHGDSYSATTAGRTCGPCSATAGSQARGMRARRPRSARAASSDSPSPYS